jgi:hypothetical protein
MSGSARVISIDALRDFRAKLAEFGKDAKDTLCAAELQIRRTFDWLTAQAKHWHAEARKREEEVVRAKIELQSRKAMCKDGRGPGTTDQEKALRKAQSRLKEAQDKILTCKRWQPLLQHAVHEYHGPARLLSGTLDTDLVHALGILAQKLDALDAYLATAVPTLSDLGPVDSSSLQDLPAAGVARPLPASEPTTEAELIDKKPDDEEQAARQASAETLTTEQEVVVPRP